MLIGRLLLTGEFIVDLNRRLFGLDFYVGFQTRDQQDTTDDADGDQRQESDVCCCNQ